MVMTVAMVTLTVARAMIVTMIMRVHDGDGYAGDDDAAGDAACRSDRHGLVFILVLRPCFAESLGQAPALARYPRSHQLRIRNTSGS